MKSRFARICAVGLSAVALPFTGSLYAASHSEKIPIPFAFRVGGKALPAGEYWMEQDFGAECAMLVNVQTRERVQVLRKAGHVQGKVKLVFEAGRNGYALKAVS